MTIKNYFEYILFVSIGWFFSLFGINNARYFAKSLAFIFFYIIPVRKKTVLSNLRKAFPDLPLAKLKQIAFLNYFSFCITLVELFSIKNLSIENLRKFVDCKDLLELQKMNKFENGAFFLTAHFGNWEVGASSIGVQLKTEIVVLAKPQRNFLVSNWLDNMRETFGNKVTLLGPSVREIYKAVNEKKIVGIVGDQRGPKDGDRVKFFNRDTAVFKGTAEIALKKNVPIFVILIVRNSDYTYKAVIEEINYKEFTGNQEEIAHKINQEYMSILEKQIIKNPEPLFGMGADLWLEAGVDLLRHFERVAMRDRGVDDDVKADAVGVAQAVDRHHQRVVFQRHFGGRQRRPGGLAHEIDRDPMRHMVIGDHADHAAGFEELDHLRQAAGAALKEWLAEFGEFRHTFGRVSGPPK